MTTPTPPEAIDLAFTIRLREIIAKGNLSHISLAMNSSHTKWRASYSPTKTFGSSFAEDEDPIKALTLVLGAKVHKAPTDREIDAAAARGNAKIEQETVDATPPDSGVEDLM